MGHISYRPGYAIPLVQWLRYPELSLDQELHNFDVQCFMVTETLYARATANGYTFLQGNDDFYHFDVT